MSDIAAWVEAFGLLAALLIMGAIVFAESGLLIGIFLPGDTLLIAAGILAAQNQLPLSAVILIVAIAAILGDNVGYIFGRRTGPRLFHKKDGLFFRRAYAERAESFFARHGNKTVFFARFIPYLRTFTPIVAGVARMNRTAFFTYNIAGALSWSAITVFIGYWLGARIPAIEHYIGPALGIGLLFVFTPTIWHFIGLARNRRRVAELVSPTGGKRRNGQSALPKRGGRTLSRRP